MLLDLYSLEYGQDSPVFVSSGSHYQQKRWTKPKAPAATDYQDLAVLASRPMGLVAMAKRPRMRARAGMLAVAPATIDAVIVARPAARWQDRGALMVEAGNLNVTRTTIDGAVAISRADDELLLLGDL